MKLSNEIMKLKYIERCTLNYENIESLRLLGAILKEHQSWFKILWVSTVAYFSIIFMLHYVFKQTCTDV